MVGKCFHIFLVEYFEMLKGYEYEAKMQHQHVVEHFFLNHSSMLKKIYFLVRQKNHSTIFDRLTIQSKQFSLQKSTTIRDDHTNNVKTIFLS